MNIVMHERGVTMREIAEAVNKPQSTIYRWKHDNPDLFQAAKDYAEKRKHERLSAK